MTSAILVCALSPIALAQEPWDGSPYVKTELGHKVVQCGNDQNCLERTLGAGSIQSQSFTIVGQLYDNTDLGKAMAICDKHQFNWTSLNGSMKTITAYHSDWLACNDIRRRWDQIQEERRKLEQDTQDSQDRAFVERVAKELK